MELKTMYDVAVDIGVARNGDDWTYAPLKAGIDNLAEAMNYVINKYQFMSNNGWGSTHVTGAHPEYTLTGKRVFGDAAQDYIFGLKRVFGAARETNLKITVTDNSGAAPVTKTVIQPITIANMQEWSGATTDDSAINIVLSCNGEPTETTA